MPKRIPDLEDIPTIVLLDKLLKSLRTDGPNTKELAEELVALMQEDARDAKLWRSAESSLEKALADIFYTDDRLN